MSLTVHLDKWGKTEPLLNVQSAIGPQYLHNYCITEISGTFVIFFFLLVRTLFVITVFVFFRFVVSVDVDWHEALEESHVLCEVGEYPELEFARGEYEQKHEDDVLDDGENDDKDEEPSRGHRQVVHTLPHLHGPEREQTHCNNPQNYRSSGDVVIPANITRAATIFHQHYQNYHGVGS